MEYRCALFNKFVFAFLSHFLLLIEFSLVVEEKKSTVPFSLSRIRIINLTPRGKKRFCLFMILFQFLEIRLEDDILLTSKRSASSEGEIRGLRKLGGKVFPSLD